MCVCVCVFDGTVYVSSRVRIHYLYAAYACMHTYVGVRESVSRSLAFLPCRVQSPREDAPRIRGASYTIYKKKETDDKLTDRQQVVDEGSGAGRV